jgi:hypothetical protein
VDLTEALLRSSAPFMACLDLLDSLQRHIRDRSGGEIPSSFPTDFVDAAMGQAASALRALRDAFARVCAQGPGVEPAVLLGVFAPELGDRLRGHQARMDGAARRADLEGACYEELLGAWRAPAATGEGR